ncbi:MAG: 1-phosphofructokinase family hexose kinase [Ruminococcaceae bacterium]|nr:1-phosphofructokinase family hexose kinase [Oscillospiraceae bacterium]
MIYTLTLNPAIDVTYSSAPFQRGGLNRVKTIRRDPGGKGINVSKTLRNLGEQTCACFLSGGPAGRELYDMLLETGIQCICAEIGTGNTRSNLKIVDSEGVTTEINEEGPSFDFQASAAIRKRLLEMVTPQDVVVISGKIPPSAPTDIYRTIIREISHKGVRVILDASGEALENGMRSVPFAVKPNALEVGINNDVEAAVRACNRLLSVGTSIALISLGDKGAVYCDRNGVRMYAEGMKIDARCTTGCGDSMTAGLAYGISINLSPEDTLRIACACGTAAALTDGTQAPSAGSIAGFEDKIRIIRL